MKLLFQPPIPHSLPLRKHPQRQRQRKDTRPKDQPQIHRQHQPRPIPQHPILQPHQDQRRNRHHRRRIQHPRQRRLPHRNPRRAPALPQTLRLRRQPSLLALPPLLLRQHGEDVDTRAQLAATHEEDVECACAGDRCERHEPAECGAGQRREALEARHEAVEAEGDGAGGGDGEEVGADERRGGEWGGFVGVGVVDGDVDGLVGDLPEEDAGVL